jgi:hypothetical protein
MRAIKIYQVQGNANAHYIVASNKKEALKKAKEIWVNERIDSACNFTENFSDDELNNLPEYVID